MSRLLGAELWNSTNLIFLISPYIADILKAISSDLESAPLHCLL